MHFLLLDKFESYAKNNHSPHCYYVLLFIIISRGLWVGIMGSQLIPPLSILLEKKSIRWWEKFTYEPIIQKIHRELELGDKSQFPLQKRSESS